MRHATYKVSDFFIYQPAKRKIQRSESFCKYSNYIDRVYFVEVKIIVAYCVDIRKVYFLGVRRCQK